MSKRTNRPIILASVMLGMFLSAIEATIVATAMPSIVADLEHFSLYSWVFSAYLLSSSATVLLFGKLADIYGRKPIYTIGMLVFLAGSVFAASTNSMVMLIVARFIQGIGAGAIMPIATTIVGDIYSKEERAKVQGYLSSVWGISAIIGPLIGAFFVDFLSWRYVFWMNIPLGLVSMVGIMVYLKEDFKREKLSIDFVGTLSMVVGISTLMYLLVETGVSIPWHSPLFYSLVFLVLISFLLFLRQNRQQKTSIIPLEIWSYPMIKVANVATLLTGMIMVAVSSYLPTFVQGVMGQSALIAGFTLTTMSIGWPLAATIGGRLLLVIGYRLTSIIGGIFLIIGSLLFLFLPSMKSIVLASTGSFFIGIGMGLTSTAFIVAIQTTVAWQERGSATASNTFMRSIGSAIGVALLGGILNNRIMQQIDEATLSNSVSLNDVDKLLSAESIVTLSDKAIEVLQTGLQSGLQFVYAGITLLAVLSLIVILFLPKKE